jgi:hypothetical protein
VKSLWRCLLVILFLSPALAHGQAAAEAADFDTSYKPSSIISARIEKKFLDSIRWNVGAEIRDQLASAFAERPALETWQELVKADGLKTGDVADAITAYWVLNWVTANARYNLKVDNGPIQKQMRAAMEADPNFRTLTNIQKQEMAEGYILKFLVEHAALNDAMARKDVAALSRLALSSVQRFRQQMGVDLLALEPGPGGLGPKAKPSDVKPSATVPAEQAPEEVKPAAD